MACGDVLVFKKKCLSDVLSYANNEKKERKKRFFVFHEIKKLVSPCLLSWLPPFVKTNGLKSDLEGSCVAVNQWHAGISEGSAEPVDFNPRREI